MNSKCYWIAIKSSEDPKDVINKFAKKNNLKIKEFRLFGRMAKIYCEEK